MRSLCIEAGSPLENCCRESFFGKLLQSIIIIYFNGKDMRMKIGIKTAVGLALIVCCIITVGCITFGKEYNIDAKPVYPELGATPSNRYPTIDTLQPDLKWTDVKSEGRTYDLCVWDTSKHTQDGTWIEMPGVPLSWGEQVYYVEGLTENHHKIAKQLKPNTCYHWSVRIRQGSKLSDWGAFSESRLMANVVSRENHVPYGFVTPEK
jgi:hypothetical protein